MQIQHDLGGAEVGAEEEEARNHVLVVVVDLDETIVAKEVEDKDDDNVHDDNEGVVVVVVGWCSSSELDIFVVDQIAQYLDVEAVDLEVDVHSCCLYFVLEAPSLSLFVSNCALRLSRMSTGRFRIFPFPPSERLSFVVLTVTRPPTSKRRNTDWQCRRLPQL